MLLRARIVLPVSQPPIVDGAILISGNRIVRVGLWQDLASSESNALDLGETILLPGLINAHCHLDYSDMAGLLSPPKYFADWIKGILALKANWSYSEYAKSWTHGAQMLLETGTTTVGDIEAVPELLPDVWNATALRVFSFLEMTGVKANRPPVAVLNEALGTIARLPANKNRGALSPHSLYATTPELIQRCSTAAREKNLRVTTHVSESREEFEMFTHSRGALFEWLKSQRDVSDCAGRSPVQQLAHLDALSSNLLAVHVNYLADGDADLLAARGTSVVHCPHSHAYFRHQEFPWQTFDTAGVNVCLGTDSLVSMNKIAGEKLSLNMFSEMRAFSKTFPTATPAQILRMATINGARALGMERQAGELSEQALADLITIPFDGDVSAVYEAVLAFSGRVSASMIDGQWAIPPAA